MDIQSQQAGLTGATELGLLDQIVEQGRLGREPAARERGKDLVKNFVAEVLKGTVTIAPDTEAMINARIAQIDELLSAQLNEIMHHAEFQRLNSTRARSSRRSTRRSSASSAARRSGR
jgi:type VI secretion system protein ImpC